ncbi:N-acetyltransferase family protein [Chitinophaga qingshengii]|uniref:N-acetyltransferase family protein n=2 Tax=Chitinophaga qingshengii TaxID=1569794 RepID=A0ABR7TG37_9BACT|nr:N-acetyltransferase family protein [Chitinophaga qingshengii]
MHLQYRDAVLEDLPEIVAIYNSTVAGRMVTADTTPVTVESRLPWFHAHGPERRPLWMAYDGETLVGWISFSSFYGRPAYDGTVEVSIYLAENARGKGYGKAVLQYAIDAAPRLSIHTLLGVIFAHNVPSIKLFMDKGFVEWAHLPDIAILDGTPRSVKILGLKVSNP